MGCSKKALYKNNQICDDLTLIVPFLRKDCICIVFIEQHAGWFVVGPIS